MIEILLIRQVGNNFDDNFNCDLVTLQTSLLENRATAVESILKDVQEKHKQKCGPTLSFTVNIGHNYMWLSLHKPQKNIRHFYIHMNVDRTCV